MSGAAGIGVFIAFVGAKDSGFIAAAPFPTLLGLNVEWPYKHGELLATRSSVVSSFVMLSAHVMSQKGSRHEGDASCAGQGQGAYKQ